MQNLSLSELLDSVGINKSVLAKLMNVSRSTIMRMNDDVSDEVLAVIEKYKQDMTPEQSESVPLPASVPGESVNPVSNILPITHRNIALSRTWHDLGNIQVARRFGLSRFDYNHAVDDTVDYCRDNLETFVGLRA